MADRPAIILFHRDLRLADNPALHAARESGAPVIPVFVADRDADDGANGPAARWWLERSLAALSGDLQGLGSRLVARKGDTNKAVLELVAETGAGAVYWNHRFTPAGARRDAALARALATEGVSAHAFNGSLLRAPGEITTEANTPYKVFTPFWRALQRAGPDRRRTLPAPDALAAPRAFPRSAPLDDLWSDAERAGAGFEEAWRPGEAGASAALARFFADAARDYVTDRDRPDIAGTSFLSPHLAFGEVSPQTIWSETHAMVASDRLPLPAAEKFLAELGWREFSYGLLNAFPDLAGEPVRAEFRAFPWRDEEEAFAAWTEGRTGYPLVDAGMRQLLHCGWMHNRVRMVAASFLTKHLLISWRRGEAWFRQHLVDGDPANNPANWQWVAGCGADAAPYFRIFNPVAQGERFDPAGAYVRRFVPELAPLPAKHIHKPWLAPSDTLKRASIRLGADYPRPIVDHAAARQRALDAYQSIRNADS